MISRSSNAQSAQQERLTQRSAIELSFVPTQLPGPRPNPPMHPTPLRGSKIGAILKAGIGVTIFPI